MARYSQGENYYNLFHFVIVTGYLLWFKICFFQSSFTVFMHLSQLFLSTFYSLKDQRVTDGYLKLWFIRIKWSYSNIYLRGMWPPFLSFVTSPCSFLHLSAYELKLHTTLRHIAPYYTHITFIPNHTTLHKPDYVILYHITFTSHCTSQIKSHDTTLHSHHTNITHTRPDNMSHITRFPFTPLLLFYLHNKLVSCCALERVLNSSWSSVSCDTNSWRERACRSTKHCKTY